MEDISILFRLDDREALWEFHLFGDKSFVGSVLNYSMNPGGELISLVIQAYRGPAIEIPWKNIHYIYHRRKVVNVPNRHQE